MILLKIILHLFQWPSLSLWNSFVSLYSFDYVLVHILWQNYIKRNWCEFSRLIYVFLSFCLQAGKFQFKVFNYQHWSLQSCWNWRSSSGRIFSCRFKLFSPNCWYSIWYPQQRGWSFDFTGWRHLCWHSFDNFASTSPSGQQLLPTSMFIALLWETLSHDFSSSHHFIFSFLGLIRGGAECPRCNSCPSRGIVW